MIGPGPKAIQSTLEREKINPMINFIRKLRVFLFSALFISLGMGVAAPIMAGGSIDHSLFAGLLEKHVIMGKVNYSGFKKDETTLDNYLAMLEKVDPKSLPRKEQFAFYANAYNAWTIKLILNGYPGIQSIKDLGSLFKSPWKKKIARIDGEVMTLDHIEHDILRPRFKDPRVHFAINCAAKSCPPLSSRPFSGDTLNQQLDQLARAFVNDPNNNYLKGDTLYVSAIFKWFKTDFKDGIVGFFLKYSENGLNAKLCTIGNSIKISYLDYDWSLNGK